MTWLFRGSIFALAFVAIVLLGNTVLLLMQDSAAVSISAMMPGLVAAGVFVALITLAVNQLRNESEDYLESATDLLSKAFEILDTDKDGNGRPKNSRMNWLTAARLVRTSEGIAELISLEGHRRIWREKKEYWRGRIRDLIYPDHDGFPESYFAQDPKHMIAYGSDVQQPLSERSLAVLYRFVRWPDGFEDPLKGDPAFSPEEIERMITFGPKRLGKLLRRVAGLRAEGKKVA